MARVDGREVGYRNHTGSEDSTMPPRRVGIRSLLKQVINKTHLSHRVVCSEHTGNSSANGMTTSCSR